MTPRVLLTAIGATAVAFAVIIGAAAGTSSSVDTPATTASTITSGLYQPSLLIDDLSGTELAVPAANGIVSRMSYEGRDCPIAV